MFGFLEVCRLHASAAAGATTANSVAGAAAIAAPVAAASGAAASCSVMASNIEAPNLGNAVFLVGSCFAKTPGVPSSGRMALAR